MVISVIFQFSFSGCGKLLILNQWIWGHDCIYNFTLEQASLTRCLWGLVKCRKSLNLSLAKVRYSTEAILKIYELLMYGDTLWCDVFR
jgi:hypothetical protein